MFVKGKEDVIWSQKLRHVLNISQMIKMLKSSKLGFRFLRTERIMENVICGVNFWLCFITGFFSQIELAKCQTSQIIVYGFWPSLFLTFEKYCSVLHAQAVFHGPRAFIRCLQSQNVAGINEIQNDVEVNSFGQFGIDHSEDVIHWDTFIERNTCRERTVFINNLYNWFIFDILLLWEKKLLKLNVTSAKNINLGYILLKFTGLLVISKSSWSLLSSSHSIKIDSIVIKFKFIGLLAKKLVKLNVTRKKRFVKQKIVFKTRCA